jgi:hypothetical protein
MYSICYGNECASSSVSDVDTYVIIKVIRFCFQHTSYTPVGISNMLAQDFSSVSLPAQNGVEYMDFRSR